MWVNGIVILHPAIDEIESGTGVGYRADPDIIALESLHESLGHTIAFGTFDWCETRRQVERQGACSTIM